MPAQVPLVKPRKGQRRGQSLVVFDLEPWYNVKKRRKEGQRVEWVLLIGILIFLLYFLLRSAVKGGVLDAWTEIEQRKQNQRGDE
jgi:hypothetical protein